jgi:hypothetical protein
VIASKYLSLTPCDDVRCSHDVLMSALQRASTRVPAASTNDFEYLWEKK